MNAVPEPAWAETAADLVEYFVVATPDASALGAIAVELELAVRSSAIRLLDVVVVSVDEHRRVDVVDTELIPGFELVHAATSSSPVVLSGHDVELAALALEPATCAVLIVAEDRWAEPLAGVLRACGGEVRGGERIARARVELAIHGRRAGRDGPTR